MVKITLLALGASKSRVKSESKAEVVQFSFKMRIKQLKILKESS